MCHYSMGRLITKALYAERLLRYYQSMGMISQVADDEYGPNNVTAALASTGGRSGIGY